ncbi:MAG: class I SAM-dependent methyltransferase [Actinobacteria bacterium]|nr:class I SAM-dependent methyltransferase [Actinomycetota bacterium]
MTDARLERWLDDLVSTPGLTSVRDTGEARRVHLDGSLAACETVRELGGAVVDVGSGGGSPGIPLAAALPELEFTLLEASARKCGFLERVAAEFPNVHVLRGRAEEQAPERYRVALARALAQPPVAAELCLPLVAAGGAAVLYVGPTADAAAVAAVAMRLNAELEERGALYVLRKLGPTPPGFPRRPGIAKKRPLA